jgi:DNA polymerase-3 subunit delta'
MYNFTPVTTSFMFGADSLIKKFLKGPLPSSMLLSGPKGVGKATLSYHLARYLFQGEKKIFWVDPEISLFKRVANYTYGDLKVLQRDLSSGGKTVRHIPVDAIREAIQFLRSTPFEGGWRVVIVDSVDELNHKSASALLKIVEEPPQNSLLILISHNIARVLPTLKSRCVRYEMLPLNEEEMQKALKVFWPALPLEERTFLIENAEGCLGRVKALIELGGKNFYEQFLKVLESISKKNFLPMLAFIDQLSLSPNAEKLCEGFGFFLPEWLRSALNNHFLPNKKKENEVILKFLQRHPFSFWLDFWSYFTRRWREMQEYSLDRRHVLLAVFYGMIEGRFNPDFSKVTQDYE